METEELRERGKRKRGHYCIAPGCRNEFYGVKAKGKPIHFHTLPLKRKAVLLRWLTALRMKNPPSNAESRICSEHFVKEDYVEKKAFVSGTLVTHRTNRLKPEVVPSVFNFTTFDLYADRRGDEDIKPPIQAGKGLLATLTSQQNPLEVNAMDSEENLQSVICEVCGTYFETRKGLSSHARLHLRQLGVKESDTSGAPIDLLYQLIKERDGSLPDFRADSSGAELSPFKTSRPESRTSLEPEDMSTSYKARSKVKTAPQKMDDQRSPARLKESSFSFLPSSPSGRRLIESRTAEGSSSSPLAYQTPTKPLWAPLETDAPITLDTSDEVHVCQLCGCWYETRKGLSSHARAHLRQLGIPDSEIKGSPIDHLYQIMEEEDLKPISSKKEELTLKSSLGSPSKRQSTLPSPPASPPIKRTKTSEDCTCILCGEEFENRKGLASHARSHLHQLGVVDLLGKNSAIDTVEELVSSGVLEANLPPKLTSSLAAPSPAASVLSPPPAQMLTSFPTTSLSPSPSKSTPQPLVNRAPKAKKGFRLAVDPLHRKPKPEPVEIEVSLQTQGSSAHNNSAVPKSPVAALGSKPVEAASSTDVQPLPSVLCDYCGQLFDTRKALSCHARAHLRQLGLTWSIKTSPIDLLKEVMIHGAEGKKESGSPCKSSWTPQDSRRSLDSLQSLEPDSKSSTSPLDFSMKTKSSFGKHGSSHTDTSCELCGFDFENRKALASHARAHLRQLGIVEWKADGATSPIELLSELIRRDPQKVSAINQRYRTGDYYIKKSHRPAASPSLSTDSNCAPISCMKPVEHKVRTEGLGVTASSSRQPQGHSRSVGAHDDPSFRSPKGAHPQKHVVLARERNLDTNSQQPSRSGSIPAMLPKPPLTPLVKLVGKVYSLKCRFCEEEFHGPLSVQEQWIRHLQKHILSLGYKGKASPPAAPVAPAPALVHPVAV